MTIPADSALFVVKITKKSGIPRDAAEWTLAINCDTALNQATCDQVTGWIHDFLALTPTGGAGPIYAWLSPEVSTATLAHTVTMYRLPVERGPLGPPLFTTAFTIGGTGGAGLPAEVAICLSFNGPIGGIAEHGPGGSRPRAHRRGRIFFGPVAVSTIIEDVTTSRVRVKGVVRTDIMKSADERILTPAYTAGMAWSVWSRLDWVLYPIVRFSMDDAFDIQRRRGPEPIIREFLVH